MLDEGNFDASNSIIATSDVTGCLSFSNALRFTLMVSSKSSRASGVSPFDFGITAHQLPMTHTDPEGSIKFLLQCVKRDGVIGLCVFQ